MISYTRNILGRIDTLFVNDFKRIFPPWIFSVTQTNVKSLAISASVEILLSRHAVIMWHLCNILRACL